MSETELDNTKRLGIEVRSRIESSSEEERIVLLDELCEKWGYTGENIFDYLRVALSNFGLDLENLRIGNFEKAYKLKVFEVTYLHLVFMKDKMSIEDIDTDQSDELVSLNTKFNKVFASLVDAENAIRTSLFLQSSMSEQEYVNDESNVGLYRFVPMDYSDMTPYQKLLIFLLEQLYRKGYRRYNGECYKQVFTKDGFDTHSWKPAMSIKAFIHSLTDNMNVNPEMWKNQTQSKSNVPAAAEYLADYIGGEFEDIVRDRHVFSFNNGIYIIKKYDEENDTYYDEWIPYEGPGSKSVGASVVACKYFNDEFHHRPDLEWFDIIVKFCPNFKGIMDYQEWPEPVQRWMCIMIGRNMYDLGELEEWQVLAYLLGLAGSGKSTILVKVVKQIYEPCDVGVLSNNIEKKFGLSALSKKFMFVGPEIKGNLAMEQSEFQSLISGEDIQVAEKHKTAKSIVWSVPGMLAGNEVPSYTDNAGSISRRLMVFKFDKKVQKGDTRLGKKLLKEITYIMQACNRGYQEAVNTHCETDIWNVVPLYFKKTKDSMAENTNALMNFLNSDKVVINSKAYVRERTFTSAFNEHCRDNHLGSHKWSSDYYLGPFETHKVTVCKKKKLRYPNKPGGRSYQGTFIMGLDIISDLDENNDDPEN